MDSPTQAQPLSPTPATPPVTPTPVTAKPFWSGRRRLILLLILAAGMGLALLWLPSTTRAALLTALYAQRTLLGTLVVFALVALSLIWSAGQRVDSWIFLQLNLHGYHPPWLDRVMWVATQLGNMVTAFLSAGAFYFLNYRVLAIEIVLGTISLWLVVESIKVLIDRRRPFLVVEGARVIGWKEWGRSFPSGHTTQSFFMVTLLIHRFQFGFWPSFALYALALFIGVTRIYVGAHYPRDVIGGAMLGAVWGFSMSLVDAYWLGTQV